MNHWPWQQEHAASLRKVAPVARKAEDIPDTIDTPESLAAAEAESAARRKPPLTAAQLDMIERKTAPSWKPEAGETICGLVIASQERESDYGPYQAFLIEDNEAGYVWFHCAATVARTQWENSRVGVDDVVFVRFNGKIQPADPNRREYASYDVVNLSV